MISGNPKKYLLSRRLDRLLGYAGVALVAAALLAAIHAAGFFDRGYIPIGPQPVVVDLATAVDVVANASTGKAAIIGPDKIAVGEGELFDVQGVTAEEFADCSIAVFPVKNRPQVLVLQTLNSRPVLYVKGRHSWKGAIILDVNIPGAYQIVIHELTIGGGPDPDPRPDPDPDPTPGEGLTVIIVENTDRGGRSPEQFRVLNGQWRKWCRENKYLVRQVHADSKAPDVAPWIKIATSKGLPYVFFVDDNGKVYQQTALPDSAEKLFDLVKKWGAK